MEPPELWTPNFDWITATLAVGGSFPCHRTAELVRDHGFSAVVDLRLEDCDDEEALTESGVAFLHLPTEDLHPPTIESLERGVRFAEHHLAQGARVLIHCEHGIGRSAVLALCVLSRHGYEPLAALRLAKDRRWRVSPSPTQYEGWARWLRREGREPPDFDTFQRIAYRHLAVTEPEPEPVEVAVAVAVAVTEATEATGPATGPTCDAAVRRADATT